jgi:hypothetical protein
MPFHPPPRLLSALASVLAAAGIVVIVASCTSHITPLGPDGPASGPTLPPPRHLGSPIILQVMRSKPATAAGKCPAGYVALSTPGYTGTCYRSIGKAVTITSAALSLVARQPSGHGPAIYGFRVVPNHDVAAVTALIAQAYRSRDALGVTVADKLWGAPQVAAPFPAQQMQIGLLSKRQAEQLYRLLVPPS